MYVGEFAHFRFCMFFAGITPPQSTHCVSGAPSCSTCTSHVCRRSLVQQRCGCSGSPFRCTASTWLCWSQTVRKRTAVHCYTSGARGGVLLNVLIPRVVIV